MNREAVYHRPYSEYCFALSTSKVVIRIRTKKNDLSECNLFYGDRMDWHNPIDTTKVKMKKMWSDQLFDYYESTIEIAITRLCYYFQLIKDKEEIFYYNDEFKKVPDINRQLYYNFHFIREEDIVHIPDWVEKAVVYQIYPDSFATGRRFISGQGNELIGKDNVVSNSMYGGTLKGITENLDYLTELGVNCIYMTPIFSSNSWHKYDTVDYFEIDPNLGTKEDFKELVESCHRFGIKIVLDGVFNHCGPDFFAFQDVKEKGKASKYYDWFYIYGYPLNETGYPNYECFSYVGTMPKLNTGNPEVADYIISVGEYWTKEFGIDGWRLDVANEINMDFWRRFRDVIRTINPEAYIIGEVWDDAKNFLQGDQFDATMNYNLYFPCIEFFAKQSISPIDFDSRIQYLLTRYKRQIQYAEMNLMGSHDVPRFLSLAGEDIRKQKLCALFLMTHVGVPMIYYGDEKGLSGMAEVEYRRPMKWEEEELDKENADLYEFYKRIIQLRKEYMNVMLGEYQSLGVDDQCIAYLRNGKYQDILIAMNNSEELVTRKYPVNVTSSVTDYILGKSYPILDGQIVLELDAFSAAVVVLER